MSIGYLPQPPRPPKPHSLPQSCKFSAAKKPPMSKHLTPSKSPSASPPQPVPTYSYTSLYQVHPFFNKTLAEWRRVLLGFAFITVTTGTRCNSTCCTHDGHLSICWMMTDKQTPAKKQEQNEDNEEDTDDGDDIYKLIPMLNFNHRSIG